MPLPEFFAYQKSALLFFILSTIRGIGANIHIHEITISSRRTRELRKGKGQVWELCETFSGGGVYNSAEALGQEDSVNTM